MDDKALQELFKQEVRLSDGEAFTRRTVARLPERNSTLPLIIFALTWVGAALVFCFGSDTFMEMFRLLQAGKEAILQSLPVMLQGMTLLFEVAICSSVMAFMCYRYSVDEA